MTDNPAVLRKSQKLEALRGKKREPKPHPLPLPMHTYRHACTHTQS